MKITDQLIRNFFDDACTPEEAAAVSKYLKDNPEVLEQYLGWEEWSEIKTEGRLPDDFWDESREALIEHTKRRPQIISSIRWAAAAAVLILVASSGYFYLTQPSHTSVPLAQQNTTITNTSDKDTTFLLPDNSEVLLTKNSGLRFPNPFTNNERNVYLKGKAFFKVAKDKTRPFTVFSNEVATTAVGTQFWITAYDHEAEIEVHLTEGKVFVNCTEDKKKQQFYLTPGEKLTFNRQLNTAAIMPADTPSKIAKRTPKTNNNPTPEKEKDKTLLSSVFDDLSRKHGIKIIYNEENVKNSYYVGTLDKSADPEKVLGTICKLNGFKIEKLSEKSFRITK